MTRSLPVSVVVANHNYGMYLGGALESLFQQRGPPPESEIVVVDRLSTDESHEVLARHSGKVSVISQVGGNLAHGCNLGFLKSRGEFVVRLDADDWLHPFATLVETLFLDENPDVGFVYPDYVVCLPDGEHRRVRLPDFDPEEIRERGDFLAGGMMIRRELLEAHSYYDVEMCPLEHYDLVLRLLASGVGGVRIPLPLYYYRWHEESLSVLHDRHPTAEIRLAQRHGAPLRRGRFHPREIGGAH